MRELRRLFSRGLRLARAAEAEGRYRDAARLHAESGALDAAAEALLFLAARAPTLRERADAYEDALRFLPEDAPRRAEVEVQLGLTRLEDARLRGPGHAEERRVLAEAAARLEARGRHADAAGAWELLGRAEDLARCLTAAGDIERLEVLLEGERRALSRERVVRAAVSEYELGVSLGQRLEARAALAGALADVPDDAALIALLRGLEARLVGGGAVTLCVGERTIGFVGTLPAGLGRDTEVRVRGASVSRRHAEIALADDGTLVVRDAGSRNGTLVAGLPLGAPLALDAPRTIGLGDDVAVRLAPAGGAIAVEVERGPDRGARYVVGAGALPIPGVRASVDFCEGFARVVADEAAALQLGERACRGPVVLLRGDVLRVDDVTFAVPE